MDHDISQITEYLYISAWPEARHADDILAKNIRLILSMHMMIPQAALWREPLRLLWLPTLDSPITPMPMFVLKRGVQAALPVIKDGHAVLVHCHYGIHRSVAMACCVMVGMGMSAEQAMQLAKEKRSVADPDAAHIRKRILKFESQWNGKT